MYVEVVASQSSVVFSETHCTSRQAMHHFHPTADVKIIVSNAANWVSNCSMFIYPSITEST